MATAVTTHNSLSEPSTTERDVSVDYLRAVVTAAVVFHHAALAYTSFSSFDPAQYTASTAPVVDPDRWPFLDVLVGYNDSFFMSLMFLISGLFVVSSLERKGGRRFLMERVHRLGIPFVVGAVTLIPLAYWPSFLLANPSGGIPYWIRFFSMDGWPSGPGWFLWLLLAFCGLLVAGRPVIARLRGVSISTVSFVGILSLSYLIPAALTGTSLWVSLGGPLDVQASRIVYYLTSFVLGAVIGTGNRFQSHRWPAGAPLLLAAGIGLFGLHIWLLYHPETIAGIWGSLCSGLVFGASSACSVLGFLALFRRHIRNRKAWMDHLSANAYGIYVVHYGWVTWTQFFLITTGIPAWMKFSITFTLGLGLSWMMTAILRKIPVVRRIL